jgi:hypothetical protein
MRRIGGSCATMRSNMGRRCGSSKRCDLKMTELAGMVMLVSSVAIDLGTIELTAAGARL